MAAGLRPLRDHGVDAARFKPARLGDCRRRGINLGSRSLHPREERRIRKAEMEAHDRGLRGLDDLRHCGVERRASGAASRSRRIEARLGVSAREALEPPRMLIRIGPGRLMAEEVDVERRRRAGANFRDLFAQDRGAQQSARDRPKTARFADGDAKLDALRPRHRRLDDRQARGKPFARHEALRVASLADYIPTKRRCGLEPDLEPVSRERAGRSLVLGDQRLEINPLRLAVDHPPAAGDHHPVGAMGAAERERGDRVLRAAEARLVESE